ncbi:MAG: hypothetical protein Q7J98_11185, partial [Kiritimatiellia bacterium]|nr:hypothetical protein [Kiritimatiellia bacterium]
MIKRIAQYSILALFLAGLGAQCPAGEGASTNDEDLVRVSWVERTPIAKRPLIFPRIQNQYYLFRNLILNYPIAKMIDRPLFYDRSLLNRKDGWGVSLVREFKVHMRNAADYGVDGLGVLTHSLGLYQSHRRIPYDAADLIRMDNFNILTEFCGQSHPDINKMVEYQDYILCRALASPYSAKINGKIVLSSYCGDLTTPEEYAEIIRRLRAAHGDSFYYMVDIGVPSGDGWKSGWGYIWLWKFYKYGGAMPKKDVEALQAYLRRYLDVCDGIHIAGAGGIQAAVTGHLFCREFYRDFLIPVLCGVLAESPYRQKLLGLSASGGHLNHYAGGNFLLHQEGTKTLRDSLDIALKAHPDYIVLPEWNEVNENTFIQPTIYNSLVTQRLLKYYTSRLKGRPPAPNPGDDRSVPNLMVSFRRVLELGEKLEIELLNIPDDTNSRMYAVEFRLLDENGKEVHRFPPQEFNG